MRNLDGRVALITGAARGQGRAHAVRLAQDGSDIIAIDICKSLDTVPYAGANEQDLQETVDEVRALGRRVVADQADVRDFVEMSRVTARGVSELGRLDIVVANAGIVSFGLTHEISEEAWDTMLDVNLKGVWHTAKAAIPHMISSGRGGAIVFISSIAGLKGFRRSGHYVAAKHGVVGLMRTMANEYAEYNIRVNTVHPTNVDTDMLNNAAVFSLFDTGIENPIKTDIVPSFVAMHLQKFPWVESSDVANAVAFLVSDEARYITGVALPVDLGVTAKT